MASGMLATLLDYLHARVELLALEAREARVAVLMRLVCGVAGAAFLLIAWIGLVTAAIGWLSRHFHWPWPLVTAGMALLHLVAGLGLLLAARRRFAQPPFRDSLNELEKDRQWLKQHHQRK